MKYKLIAFAAVLHLMTACAEKTDQPELNVTVAPTDTAAQQPYFPVFDFLTSEIHAIDSLPVGLMQYRSSATFSDSGYIQLSDFHKLVDEFVPSALNDSAFSRNFQETSFLDKSTGGATFFYNARNEKEPLRRIDVVTEKTDTYDKVKSIYIEKIDESRDSAVTKKLHWKPGRNFQMVIQVSKAGTDPRTELVKVIWDNRE